MNLPVQLLMLSFLVGWSSSSVQGPQAPATPPTQSGTATAQPDSNSADKDYTPPEVTSMVTPDMPEEALRKKVGGSVVVALIVDANGNPQNVHVVSSPVDKVDKKAKKAALALNQKVMEAIRKYHFKPATRAGQAVSADLKIEIIFPNF